MAAVRDLAADAVWDSSPMGMEVFEGRAAIRGFFVDWIGTYEEFSIECEEILDLGNGVVFAAVRQGGRPIGSTGHVELRYAAVAEWADGVAVRITNYSDVDEARVAAERLAAERG